MNVKQLARELHRIAVREVPDGEPDLWPAIRSRVAYSQSRTSPTGGVSSSGNPQVSSIYVWHEDDRHKRVGKIGVLAAGTVLVLVIAVLVVVLGNRGNNGDDRHFVSSGGVTPTLVFATGSSSPFPQTNLTWPRDGSLTIPAAPAGYILGGTIHAQILPTGDVRISYAAESSTDTLIWHVVSVSCKARQTDGHDLVPPFVQPGGSPTLVPAAKTHQPMNVVGFKQQGSSPVICASIPAVPTNFVASYAPAAGVPPTCPVTLPSQPVFTPPDGQSADPVIGGGDYWYGTDNLWTGLPLDGVWQRLVQKVFWWSAKYDVNTEPSPALSVTGTRLDGESPHAQVDRPTNAAGGMLVGIDFPTSGCWQVTGQYKGQSLSFVVWVQPDASTQAIQTSTVTPGADGLTHTDLSCHATSFAPSSAHPSDVNVEFRGVASSGQFWALLFRKMPIYAQQSVQFAWKIGGSGTFTVTFEDSEGRHIGPVASSTGPITSSGWPRPGTEWITGVEFPHSGCWHAHAQSGNVTGDMWFEVFSHATGPMNETTPTPIAATSSVTMLECFGSSPLTLRNQPTAAFNDQDLKASVRRRNPDAALTRIANVLVLE